MKYNDNQLINNQQIKYINDNFRQIDVQQIEDLHELYNKLLEQRNFMQTNNSDHSLDRLISTTNKHLDSLSRIINTSNSSQYYTIHNAPQYRIQQIEPIPYPHFRPYLNSPRSNHPEYFSSTQNNNELPNNNSSTMPNLNLPNTNNNTPNIDENQAQNPFSNNNQNSVKNPLIDDSNNSLNIINNPIRDNLSNNNNTINNGSNSPNPPLRRRNSPLQSNILSTIAQRVFGGLTKNKLIIKDDKYRNRFHNIITQSHNCNPRRKMVTNELDILRLLLLYIALRPHSRYIDTLSNIASEQLEILMHLI